VPKCSPRSTRGGANTRGNAQKDRGNSVRPRNPATVREVRRMTVTAPAARTVATGSSKTAAEIIAAVCSRVCQERQTSNQSSQVRSPPTQGRSLQDLVQCTCNLGALLRGP
jgi:hypothetical protein